MFCCRTFNPPLAADAKRKTSAYAKLLRGESSPARRSRSRKSRCTSWRGGGSRAIRGFRNGRARLLLEFLIVPFDAPAQFSFISELPAGPVSPLPERKRRSPRRSGMNWKASAWRRRDGRDYGVADAGRSVGGARIPAIGRSRGASLILVRMQAALKSLEAPRGMRSTPGRNSTLNSAAHPDHVLIFRLGR
jgi:hypothetical protein